jgi:hypothetical protein
MQSREVGKPQEGRMEKAITTSRSLDNPLQKIKIALTELAIFRGAKLDPITLRLYSSNLADKPAEDVVAACQKLQELVRKEGESALPEIGVFLAATNAETVARKNRIEAAKHGQSMVGWRCIDCKNVMTGFPASNDDLDRRCESPYRWVNGKRGILPYGQICGGRMEVIFNDVVKADSGPLEPWDMSGTYKSARRNAA